MKKVLSIVAIVALSMMAFSCKNNSKNAEENCCEMAEGECTECTECAESENTELIEASEEDVKAAEENAELAKANIAAAAEALGDEILNAASVEVAPTFEGGDANSFLAWVNKNIKYPNSAVENNEQGRVVVNFVVGKDGKISNVKVLRGVSEALDAEAVRVVSSAPAWTPASNKGKAVAVSYSLPVTFNLK